MDHLIPVPADFARRAAEGIAEWRKPMEPQPELRQMRFPVGMSIVPMHLWVYGECMNEGGNRISWEEGKESEQRVADAAAKHAPYKPGDRLGFYTADCECFVCCEGEHVGRCRECAGWGDYCDTQDREHCSPDGVCTYCYGSGDCPKCVGCSRYTVRSVRVGRAGDIAPGYVLQAIGVSGVSVVSGEYMTRFSEFYHTLHGVEWRPELWEWVFGLEAEE